jgi:hypothetical protein
MNETANVQNTDRVEDAKDQVREYRLRILQTVLIVLGVLVMVAFWGTFAYSIVTENVKLAMLFGKIIGLMIGVVVPVAILHKLYQHVTKK